MTKHRSRQGEGIVKEPANRGGRWDVFSLMAFGNRRYEEWFIMLLLGSKKHME